MRRLRVDTSFIGLLLCCILSFCANGHASGFPVAEGNMPASTILLGTNATHIEEFAASELVKYVKHAAGAELLVVKAAPQGAKNLILIGRAETNPAIASLIEKGMLELSPEHPGLDGFVIRTISDGNKNYLVLGGSVDRGSLYAVYHFLEHFLDIGFFWEGDVIPARKTIKPGTINISERPYYKNRFYMQECPFAYNTRGWSMDDWKREIRWMSKKKLNMLMVPGDNWNFRVKMDDILSEAKKLGIQPVLGGELIRWELANKEFMGKNPGHRYVKAHWWLNPPYHIIHPADPLFLERGKKHIRSLVEQYGKGNIYFISPYGEQTFMDVSAEEITEIRTSFAKSIGEILKAEDPQGTWTFWTWPFISPPWPMQDVKKFLLEMPENSFICDSSQPETPGGYHYKQFNYFEGQKWVLSFIHLYGGDDHLCGNLPQIVKDIQALLADERAKNCTGIYICPEIIHYNTVYFDMLAKLGWNPETVKFEDFLKDYLSRRYGLASYDNMSRAWRHLLNAVYGKTPGNQPVYQKRMPAPGTGMLGVYLTEMAKNMQESNTKLELEKALAYFAAEADTQKNNPCFTKDFVDVMRQYLTELFNRHFYIMQRAYAQKDKDGFSAEKDYLLELLDLLENILAAYPPYQIRPMVKELKDLPGFSSFERTIKGPMYTFAGHWLVDYQSKDIYELVKYYYRARVELFLGELSNNLDANISQDNLIEKYKAIEEQWLKAPLKRFLDSEYPSQNAVEAVKKAMAKAEQMGKKRGEVPLIAPENIMTMGRRVDLKKAVWTEDFSDTSDWKITFFEGGRFTSDGKTATISHPENKPIVFGRKLQNFSVNDYPVLTFRFKQPGKNEYSLLTHETGGSCRFVVWVTWRDNTGRQLRNRVFQKEMITYDKWTDASLNLKHILSMVSVPATVEMIEIDSAVTMEWDNMQLGAISNNPASSPSNNPADGGGLIGHWSFDEGKGGIAGDSSHENNNGTIVNAVFTEGVKNTALQFNGTDSRVELPHSDKMDISKGFSFSLFVRAEPVEGGYDGRTIIGKPGSYLTPTIFTSRRGTGAIFIVGAEKNSYQVQGAMTPGQWHHLAMTFDGKILSGYIDGEKVGEKDVPAAMSITKNPLTIGYSTAQRAFKGAIDEVKFYNRALTAGEVLKEYAALAKQRPAKKVPETQAEEGLLGYYPLNETTGTTAHDISGNNYHGKLVGVIWKQGEGGSAAEFNGRNSYISIPHKPELNIREAITLQALVNLTTVDGDHGFISKGRGTWGSGYTFQQANGRLQLGLNTTVRPGEGIKANGYLLQTDPVIKAGEWAFVAATYDSSEEKARIYKDGELVQEFAAAGRITYLPPSDYRYDTVPVSLSGIATFPHLYSQLNGFMREAKIYSRALSAEEIKQEYARVKPLNVLRLKTEQQMYEESLTCRLAISVREQATGRRLKARVFIKGANGRHHLPAGRFCYGTERNGYFYLLDDEPIKLPEGEFEMTALTGFEHKPATMKFTLRHSESKTLEVQMERWINMPAKQWYAGEHHLHAIGHGRRIYDELLGAENAAKLCEAAGLNYAVLMQDVGFKARSGDEFIAMGGREWTPSLGGHMCLVNIQRQPKAGSSHFSNMQVIDDVLSQGGVAVYTHPTSGIDFGEIGAGTHSREMPVAVALGKMPIWDVSYGGLHSFDHALISDWYRYLNLGFRLAAGASTDLYMNNPVNLGFPGIHRTYAKLDSLSWEEIAAAYKEGRTFITAGPLLIFKVSGKGPGESVQLDGRRLETLKVEVEASFLYGINRVEIIKNGVVAETIAGNNKQMLQAGVEIPADETCWLAARVYGNSNDYFGTLAHTSPVYVQYGKEKIRVKQEDIDYFVRWLEDYRKLIPEYCKYRKADGKQAETLLSDIQRAIEVYSSLRNN